MPNLKTYDLFLSHVWNYSSDYERVVKMLNEAFFFYWRNYSVPENKPLVDSNTWIGKNKLIAELDEQIKPVNCVLIFAGMYATYSDWIIEEIKIAQKYNKPIIGIQPWGQSRIPNIISENVDIMVGWNTVSIVSAIRKYSI
jgi:hypothetical protein